MFVELVGDSFLITRSDISFSFIFQFFSAALCTSAEQVRKSLFFQQECSDQREWTITNRAAARIWLRPCRSAPSRSLRLS